MKIKNITGLLALMSVLAGGVFAIVREGSRPKGIGSLASYASDGDQPTLANAIRMADFVGEVRILDIKRRGVFTGVDETTHRVVIDENDKNVSGDEVLLKAEDIRRDGLVTEYNAEVISVMDGSLKSGERFTLRVPGYGPLQPKSIEKNASSSIPVEVTGDEFVYVLVKQADGVYAPINAVTFRMKQDGDKLLQSFYGKDVMKDYDGSVVTMESLTQSVKENFGKGPIVYPVVTPAQAPVEPSKDGPPIAVPAQPVGK